MIHILEDKPAVEKVLRRDLYRNLGAVNFLGNVPEAKAYVMDGSLEDGVIVTQELGRIFLATKCEDFMDEFWDMLPGGHHFFPGAPDDIAAIFLRKRKAEWTSPCKVYVIDGHIGETQISSHICQPLRPEDAEEVDMYYTYRSEDTVERLRDDIVNMDSSCIRIDGQLAAWCLVHGDDGQLGPLYTKKEFRRQGLAEIVSYDLTRKLLGKKVVPYMHIVADNVASLGLIAKLNGARYSHDCLWFGVVK